MKCKKVLYAFTMLLIGTIMSSVCFYGCDSSSLNDDTTTKLPSLSELEDVDDVCTKMKDINFMAYCYDNFDVNHDGKVSMTEAAAVNTMSCSTATDFTGIEYFTNLKSFTSTSVETIDLRYNTELASIEFKNSPIKQIDLSYNLNLTSLGDYAFSRCSSLTSITLSPSLNLLGREAFRGCTGITEIGLPQSLTTIGPYAFSGCTGLTSVDLPSGLTSIGEWAFAGCAGPTFIDLPSGLTSLGAYAFMMCTGLTSVTFPSTLPSIEYGTFRDCTGLTSITFPSGMTSIGIDAFLSCTGLISITLPSSLTTIRGEAFGWCSSLNTVLTNAITPPSLDSDAFHRIDDPAVLYVPSESVEAYKDSDWAQYFDQILAL